jgi:hypothetical protein
MNLRLRLGSAQRVSICRLRPMIQPDCANPCSPSTRAASCAFVSSLEEPPKVLNSNRGARGRRSRRSPMRFLPVRQNRRIHL